MKRDDLALAQKIELPSHSLGKVQVCKRRSHMVTVAGLLEMRARKETAARHLEDPGSDRRERYVDFLIEMRIPYAAILRPRA